MYIVSPGGVTTVSLPLSGGAHSGQKNHGISGQIYGYCNPVSNSDRIGKVDRIVQGHQEPCYGLKSPCQVTLW